MCRLTEKKKLIVERKRIEAAVKSGETKEEDAMDKKEQIYKDLLYIKVCSERQGKNMTGVHGVEEVPSSCFLE